MDLAWECPGSHHPAEGEPLIDAASERLTAVGNAAHEVLTCIVENEPYDLAAVCAKYNLREDDVRFLAWAADNYAATLRDDFDVERWTANKRLSQRAPFPADGEADIFGMTSDGKTIVVADLKSGFADRSYEHQLRAYVRMGFTEYPTAEKGFALILWARDLEIQKWEYGRDELDAWAARMRERVWGWDGVNYVVGGHCGFCRRHASCPARARELESAYALMAAPEGAAGELVGESMARAWQASVDIPKVIAAWRQRIRERVAALGPIDLGDARELAIVERTASPDIDAEKAAKVLRTGFGFSDSEFYAACKMQKKAIEDRAAAGAPRGKKGAARKQVIKALEEHGALERKTNLVLTTRKKVEDEGR
jgi:hypothetical protein